MSLGQQLPVAERDDGRPRTATFSPRQRRIALGIWVVSFGLYVAYHLLWVGVNGYPGYDYDCRYEPSTNQILAGKGCGYREPPLVPYLMAAHRGLFGPSNLPLRITYAALAAGAVTGVFLLGCALGGTGPGLCAALLAGLSKHYVYFSAWLMAESPLSFLWVWGVLLIALAVMRRNLAFAFGGGVLLGLAVLAKQTAAGSVVLAPVAFWLILRENRRLAVSLGALVVAGATAVVLPYVLKCYFESGRLFFVACQFSDSFFVGNIAPYEALQKPGVFTQEELDQWHGGTRLDRDRVYWSRTWKYIPEHLREVLGRFPEKLGEFFGLSSNWRSSNWPERLAMMQYWALWLLFAAGIWMTRAQWPRYSLIYFAILTVFTACMLTLATPRFRIMTEVFGPVVAGVGLWRLICALRDRRAPALLPQAVAD